MSTCGVVSSGVTDKLGSLVMWTVLPCLCVFVSSGVTDKLGSLVMWTMLPCLRVGL